MTRVEEVVALAVATTKAEVAATVRLPVGVNRSPYRRRRERKTRARRGSRPVLQHILKLGSTRNAGVQQSLVVPRLQGCGCGGRGARRPVQRAPVARLVPLKPGSSEKQYGVARSLRSTLATRERQLILRTRCYAREIIAVAAA